MSLEFNYYSLGDLVKIKYGKNQKKVQDDENGKYPIYGTGGLMGYSIDYLYDKPSVLIGRKGSIEKVRYIEEPFWTVDTLFYTEVNEEIVIPKFLYYVMSLMDLSRYNEGTSIPSLRTETLNRLDIPITNLDYQKRVLTVLSNIDKKISINEEINRNLLQLSKVIFKNWFVEFEPFGGVQPDDWKICALEDVCDLNAGGDKPEVVSDEITDSCIYPIYSNGLDNDGLYGYTNHAKIFEECVTVSARGTIGFVCLRHTPYVPIVRLVSVIPKKKFISAKYLYLFLDRLNIMGTGTTQQQLTIPDFKKTEILVPTLDVIKSFTNHLNPLFEKIWMQEEEMKKLSKLRDTLLPKLMSGEIDVSKINCDMLQTSRKNWNNEFTLTLQDNLIEVIS